MHSPARRKGAEGRMRRGGGAMEERKRICRRCLLRDLAEEDQRDLKKYLALIKPQDRADEAEYERRLQLCRDCELLQEATCLACGCYAEFRALGRRARCPKKKW